MATLELQGRFNRPNVASGKEADVQVLITVSPDAAMRELSGSTKVGTHVCLLFDVSQSMEESDKLDCAIAAGRELIDLVSPDMTLSIIAFDEDAHILGSALKGSDREGLRASLESLRRVGGGMTNIAEGLAGAISEIRDRGEEGQARAIILLSDGEDNFCKPDAIQAAIDAADADIQVFAVGIGDGYEADFLKALVTPSNGRIFGHTDVQRVREAFIDLAVTLANVVATHTVLEVTFAPGVLVGRGYKSSPEQLFLGNTKLGDSRSLTRRLGNIERTKAYGFLYELQLPALPPGEFGALTVTLTYDVPALGITKQSEVASFIVSMSNDNALTGQQDGAVQETWRRVQITELVERFVDAHKGGHATQTAVYLGLLIDKYDDVGDQAMVNHYTGIRSRLVDGGTISRTMINQSVVSSTVVRGGGEIPTLIDDAF